MTKLKESPYFKGLLLILIITSLAVAIFWRSLSVLRYQQLAGGIIQSAVSEIPLSEEISYRCFLSQLAEVQGSDIKKAMGYLQKAIQLKADNPHTAYLLGQAHCLTHEYQSAIEVLEEVQNSGENNPNLFIESGFAYMALMNRNADSITHDDFMSDYSFITESKMAFLNGSVSVDQLTALADNIFEFGNLIAAFKLYKVANVMQPLSEIEEYRFYLSAKITEQPDWFITRKFNMPILMIEDYLMILPENMYVLNQAKRNPISLLGEIPFAVIYSQKSDAIILVDFSEAGDYVFEFSFLDQPPSPTILQISLDFLPIAEVKLQNGDGIVVVQSIRTPVSAGVHSLSIKLANDIFENGLDRNGYVVGIEIVKIEN